MELSAFDLLVLRELPGVGDRTMTRLLERARRRGHSLRQVLDAPPSKMASDYGLPAKAIARLSERRDPHLERCRWISEELERAGGHLLTLGRNGYPVRVARSMASPPPMLFALGNESISDLPCVAVLSSREIADHTLAATVAIIRTAHEENLSIAIGGMKSTHRLAAITSRAIGIQRIVVLERGLFAAFSSDFHRDPFGCGRRRAPLNRASTLVLSPFRPEDHAAPNSARRRDEILAALGDVIFASSARPGGETERSCLTALDRGKPVLVWDGNNRTLLRAGAMRVDAIAHRGGLRRLLENAGTTAHALPATPPSSRPHPPGEDRTPRSREG